MSAPSADQDRPSDNLYGAFAFGIVIVTCYASFFAPQSYYRPASFVPVTFLLGALYGVIGVFGAEYADRRGAKACALYYAVQCALLTAILFVSPVRAFLGILVLPVVSQAIFDLRPRNAVAVGLYLFGLNTVLWTASYGWLGATRAFLNYAAAFVFTIVFSIITKQAVNARTREQQLREKVEEANRQLRDHALQTAELATTRERNRVAREIHDGVGHYLTVVKTQLDAAAALLPAQPERAREALTKAARLAGEALEDVRRSVGTLRTDHAPLPLPQALQRLTEESDLPVTVRVHGEPRPLAPAVQHTLFRAAQEGLTNVRKHARASAAEVSLDFVHDHSVTLAVLDDGQGCNGATKDNGFGLLGIRERVEVLGGRVTCGNRPTGGFALTVEVPT